MLRLTEFIVLIAVCCEKNGKTSEYFNRCQLTARMSYRVYISHYLVPWKLGIALGFSSVSYISMQLYYLR